MIFVVGYHRFICVTAKQAVIHYYVWRLYYFMQFERITYQRVFNLGNYESVRIGADVLINPGEDAKEALKSAKEFVDQWQKENNAYHFADQTPSIPVIPKNLQGYAKGNAIVSEENSRTEINYGKTLEEEIQSCKSIAVLKIYEKRVKGKKDLEEIYNQKLEELQ